MMQNPLKQDRRTFLMTQSAALGGALLLPTLSGNAQEAALTETQRRSLMLALKQADSRYNPEEQMISGSVSGVGYHTTLKSGTVHHTRGSLQYAAALMASGVERRIQRAKDILRKVISLQDQNPTSRTYGIWSWYLEEPLEQMSPPDWNWADFCSVQLLKIWIGQPHLLELELRNRVEESIVHAARSIQRRNVGPGYTNIAMMGTYVTVTVGERMNQPDIHQYGKERLRRVHRYTMENGSFREYNSSTYSIVAIAELTRMLMHFQDETDRALAMDMHDLAWKHLATHFHAPTRQLAGPQSRCYSTDLRHRSSTLAFLELATGRNGKLLQEEPLPLGLDHSLLDIQCPSAYRDLFFILKQPRTVREVFSTESNGRSIVGTTYLHPHYTLGSVNYGDFWVQRRPILGYWGTAEKPAYLQVRFLHDGYDYCSAIPITLQKENRLFTVVSFATDYGDTHVSLDKIKDAAIQASDLRLRFEIGGETEGLQWIKPEEASSEHVLISENAKIRIMPGPMVFDGKDLTLTDGEDGLSKEIICFQTDEESTVRLDQLGQSYITFCIEIITEDQPASQVNITHEAERFTASWNNGSSLLSIKGPDTPQRLDNLPVADLTVN